jgi:hypothetical protein
MSSSCVDAKSIIDNADYNNILLRAISNWPKWKLVSLSMENSDKEFQDMINNAQNGNTVADNPLRNSKK